MAIHDATIGFPGYKVVPRSPAKNSNIPASIPNNANNLECRLLASITMEIIIPAIISALRPAVAVIRNTIIPAKGSKIAIIAQILLFGRILT